MRHLRATAAQNHPLSRQLRARVSLRAWELLGGARLSSHPRWPRPAGVERLFPRCFYFPPGPIQGWLHLAAFGLVRNGRELVPMRGRVRVRVRRVCLTRSNKHNEKHRLRPVWGGFSFCPRPSSQGWLHLAAFGLVRNGRELVPMRGRVRVRVRRVCLTRSNKHNEKHRLRPVWLGVFFLSAALFPGVATFGCIWPGQKRKEPGPNARARARPGETTCASSSNNQTK